MAGTFEKDPDVTDYYWQDFTDWLEEGDTIDTADWTLVRGDVVIDSQSLDDARAVVWLSGGTGGTSADLTVHVEAASGRSADETITILLGER